MTNIPNNEKVDLDKQEHQDDLNEVIRRLMAIEQQAIHGLRALPQFFVTATQSFPYTTHRFSGWAYETDSEQYWKPKYTVTIRLVVAHLKSGYDGSAEFTLYKYFPLLLKLLVASAGDGLVSARFEKPMLGLDPEEIEVVDTGRFLSAYQDGSVGVGEKVFWQVGAEIPVNILFHQDL